jgi:hypothetical protein
MERTELPAILDHYKTNEGKLEAIHFVRQHYENWNNHRQFYRTRKTDGGPALKLSRSLMRFRWCFWFQV